MAVTKYQVDPLKRWGQNPVATDDQYKVLNNALDEYADGINANESKGDDLQSQIDNLVVNPSNTTIGVFSEIDAVNTNNYTVTTGVVSYFVGWKINLTVANNNTSNVTVNPDGLGAQSVKVVKIDGAKRECQPDEVSGTVQIEWDGTDWVIISSKTFDDYNRPVIGGGILINGNFDVWEEGAGPFTGAVYTAGQWEKSAQGQVDRSTDVPDSNSKYSLKYSYTGTTAAVFLFTQIENPNNLLYNKECTLSFMVKANVAKTVSAVLRNETQATNIQSVSYDITTDWTKVVISFDASTTWTNDDVILLRLLSGDLNNGDEIYYSQVKLEFGSAATNFIPKSVEKEERACRRYYKRFKREGSGQPFAVGTAFTSVSLRAFLNFNEDMRINPTVTVTDLGSGLLEARGNGTIIDISAMTIEAITDDGLINLVITAGASSFSNNQVYVIAIDEYLVELDARL